MTITLTALVIMLALHLITPFWWWIAAVPLVFGLVFPKQGAFWRGALASGGAWLLGMIWALVSGASLIAGKVADILMVKQTVLLVLITFVWAALTGGVAAAAGKTIRKMLGQAFRTGSL